MKNEKHSSLSLILILGALTALSPFSIDMYLPAFPKMAEFFSTNVSAMSLSLSSYFIGLAVGQLLYGPLLDRFGRKKPLYFGLLIYIFATVGCFMSKSMESFVLFRFIQAFGGCAANVAAMAMVRDFFSPKESSKIFSLLVLILGVSPLLAPTTGGFLSVMFGWQSIFIALTALSVALFLVTVFLLPEGRGADASHSLRPGKILLNYVSIIKDPQFSTYALAGSVAFAGLFVYLAASPTIFMEVFKVSEQAYGWIFGFLAVGFIGASQFNIPLSRVYSNERILFAAFSFLAFMGFLFPIGAGSGWLGLTSTMVMLFLYLSSVGLANPNAAALALAPFSKNAGSAAALLGFLQMTVGSLASVFVGVFKAQELFPISVIFAGTAFLSLFIFILGSRRITSKVEVSADDPGFVTH